MPLYEYRCQQCQRHTEKRQKFSDPEITACPHCGGHLERVLSAPNIAFKGGGWYKDLYSSTKPAAAGESKAEGKSESKGEGAPSSESAKPTSSGGESTTAAPAPTTSSTTPAPAAPANKS